MPKTSWIKYQIQNKFKRCLFIFKLWEIWKIPKLLNFIFFKHHQFMPNFLCLSKFCYKTARECKLRQILRLSFNLYLTHKLFRSFNHIWFPLLSLLQNEAVNITWSKNKILLFWSSYSSLNYLITWDLLFWGKNYLSQK